MQLFSEWGPLHATLIRTVSSYVRKSYLSRFVLVLRLDLVQKRYVLSTRPDQISVLGNFSSQ
jgi:hypothetical protein